MRERDGNDGANVIEAIEQQAKKTSRSRRRACALRPQSLVWGHVASRLATGFIAGTWRRAVYPRSAFGNPNASNSLSLLRTLLKALGAATFNATRLGARLRRPQSWLYNCGTANRRVDTAEFAL